MKQTSQPREDLRQRRTRKLLADALLSLLEERPLSEISVVDICQRAMVHRTTFYAHFDDKLALLRYASSRWTPPWTHVPGPGSILWSFFTTRSPS